MRSYAFKIRGNQEGKAGNPIPYFRTTQKGKWSDDATRYADWKGYVRGAFYDSGTKFTQTMVQQYLLNKPPIIIEKGEKARMDILITFCNEAHGDSDNVFKGIADALFHNDKHMAGSFDYAHGPEGLVEVSIQISSSAESAVDAQRITRVVTIG